MKKIYYLFVFVTLLSFNTKAQNIVDNNTNIIENYFLQQANNTINQNVIQKSIDNSDVVVLQIGNDNQSEISINEESTHYIQQNGNQNNYEYFTYYSSLESNVRTTQNGNNNDILIYGENSISKNMRISQNTSNQTIIITNY